MTGLRAKAGFRAGRTLAGAVLWCGLAPLSPSASAQEAPCFFTLGDPAWSEGPSSDGPPCWTPDGSRIVFQFTRETGFAQIYSIRPDGRDLRRITDGSFRAGHPHWGPDGRIAFVSDRDGEREIYSMRPDGTDVRRLTRDGTPKSFPVYGPDGSLVAFVRSVDETAWRRDLCILDLATGEQHTLHESPNGLGWIAWSPDGSWIYFYEIAPDGTNQVFRKSVDGLELEQVTGDPSADSWCPDVSPDGTRLSYIRGERPGGEWGADGDLVVANADGSQARAIASGPWHENSARFDPTGTRLAYMSAETGYYELHVIDVDGANDRRLTFQPEEELTAVVRARGVPAGLAHFDRHAGRGKLASDYALRKLFEHLSADGRSAGALPAVASGELLALARIYAAWYPDSPHARRALASAAPESVETPR